MIERLLLILTLLLGGSMSNYIPDMQGNTIAVGPTGGAGKATMTSTGLTGERTFTFPDADGQLQANPAGAQRLPFAGDGAGLAPAYLLKLNIPGSPGPVTVPFAHDVLGLYGDVTSDAVGESLNVTGSTGYSSSVPADAAGTFWGGGNSGLRAAGSTYTGAASGGGVQGDVVLLIAPRASS